MPALLAELSELRLLGLFLDQSADAFFAIRASDGRVLYVNAAVERLYGYSQAELLTMTVDQVSDAYGGVELAERMREYRERGHIVFETTHRAKDGSRLPVEVTLSYVKGHHTDFTVGLVRSLATQRQLSAALDEAEQRWRIALEASDRGVWDWDATTGAIYFSPRCVSLLGFPEIAREMSREAWQKQIHPDDHAEAVAALDTHLAGGSALFISEHRARNAEGGHTWVHTRGRVIRRDEEGRPLRMAGTLTIVHERKRAELLQRTRGAVLDRVLSTPDSRAVFAEIARRVEDVQVGWRVSIIVVQPPSPRMRCACAPSFPAWYADFIDSVDAGPGVGSCGSAIHGGEPVYTADITTDPSWAPWRDRAAELGLRACWSVPFKDDAGVVRGSLAVYRPAAGLPNAAERELIEEFARIAALADQRVRAAEAQRLAAAVFENTHDGVVVTDLRPAIVAVNQAYSRITGYSADQLVGRNPNLLASGRHDAAFYRALWDSLTTHGHWQGELWNRRASGEIYPQWVTLSMVRDPEGRPSHYVGVCTDISQAKRSEQELERLAHYDALTGLPNRLLGLARLSHALDRAARRKGQVAVLFMDLDHFKTVNDSLGHPVGDELLAAFAQRASQRLRGEDTLARLGGDEFLVVLEQVDRPEDAAAVARALLVMLEQPFELANGLELHVSASVGISLYPHDGGDADTLIQHADSAMYQAKGQGRRTLRFYTDALTRDANERLALEAALRRAIPAGGLTLHYQPQLLQDPPADAGQPRPPGTPGRLHLAGVEALLRWEHPELGLVLPDRFIPLAEETGLIHVLGDWVLGEACAQARRWADAGQPLRVAVNLSARQFAQRDLVEHVAQVLAHAGVPARLLELEITESALMEQPELAAQTLAGLRALGVTLSIDDFGTGYSSLAYLRRLAVDRLKVDRSFVAGLPGDGRDRAITQAIVTMAHSLGMQVVAEGVETVAQWQCLDALGCDGLQGWLCSPAVPAAGIDELLVEGCQDRAWMQALAAGAGPVA